MLMKSRREENSTILFMKAGNELNFATIKNFHKGEGEGRELSLLFSQRWGCFLT